LVQKILVFRGSHRKKYRINIIEEETKINGKYWGRPADRICLNCGKTMDCNDFKKNNSCDICGSTEIIFWKDLPGKKCPSCNGEFTIGIKFNSEDEYTKWNIDEWIEETEKAKRKYGIKEEKTVKEITEEEKRKFEKENVLVDYFTDQRFVINHKYNVIKFDCHRSFHSDFCIIVEWFKDNEDGYIIFCMRSSEENENRYIASNIEKYKIQRLLEILDKYKYFSKPNKIKRFGFDGSRWTLEVQIKNKYKEIDVWTPKNGVIYDVGKKLIEYSGAIINNLY